MQEIINAFGTLLWALLKSSFSLYQQLSGIKNDFLAAALGVSPFVLTILVFVIKRIIKLIDA